VDHGNIDGAALTTDVAAARRHIAALGDVGLDFDEITALLQDVGVKSFAASFDDLLATVAGKIADLA
jgi:transaldolase